MTEQLNPIEGFHASPPRGIRNNNPGNVEYSNRTIWLGLAKPPTDGRFCKFVDAKYGIRVISKLLIMYHDFHDCDTLQDYISRWAPSVENDVTAYVNAVALAVGYNNMQSVTVTAPILDATFRSRLISGIIRHENGVQPYTLASILAACSMA